LLASRQLDGGTASYGVVTAKDGGVILDIQGDRLLKLNATGAQIWELLQAGEAESQVVVKIAKQYGIDQERVAKDVDALVTRLSQLGLGPRSSQVIDRADANDKGTEQASFPWYGRCGSEADEELERAYVFFALIGLAAFDFILSLLSLKALCSVVRAWPAKSIDSPGSRRIGNICKAVEKACVWYPKKALCLQRSAVTACLLRNAGVPARLTIGVRPMPLRAHAWVEVDGCPVNDWPKVKTFYRALVSY
jgi:hypothetical protein